MPEIDLSRLPAPAVVEALDYEVILAELTADFVGRYPDYTAWVESDPALKLLEVSAYREMLLRHRINEAAKSIMLAFARGSDLDHLVALTGVVRAPGESDERLLRRFRVSFDALSVAGPRGAYEFHALTADVRVRSVDITTPTPGAVQLVVIGGDHADGLPDAALVATVQAAVSGEDVRPLTDAVTVLAARNICYRVQVVIDVADGPDRTLVQSAAERRILAYLLSQHRVGATVYKSAILGAAHVADVVSSEATFYWDSTAVDADELGPTALMGLPNAWRNVAALWPANPDSVVGGATTLSGEIQGYAAPATAPADGLTVTIA